MLNPFTIALAVALVAIAVAHWNLRRRHRRCKAALERVAGERDTLRDTVWAASQRAADTEPQRLLTQG